MPRIHLRRILMATVVLSLAASLSAAPPLEIEQLDLVGTGSSTTDSGWGRVAYIYPGSASPQYLNLSLNGSWAIRNLSLGSPGGVSSINYGVSFVDLGVTDGTDVSLADYGFMVTSSPLLAQPTETISGQTVSGLSFQIGGEDGIDTGTRTIRPETGSASDAAVVKSGQIPGADSLHPMPQHANECAPGAISNSLQYLRASGKLDGIEAFPDTIDGVKTWTPWLGQADGTAANWPSVKKTYLEGKGLKVTLVEAPLSAAEIDFLIAQLKDGQDIEMDLEGHVEWLVGLRVKADGTVELDLIDDNQTDLGADGIHTSRVKYVDGVPYVDGMKLERFVVECPEPGTLVMLSLGVVVWLRRQR